MIKPLHYIFLVVACLLAGCSKSEFQLNFNLNENITENYNVTYFATDVKGGVTVQAVASVREGKCLLNGITKNPTLIYVTEKNSSAPTLILVHRGDKIDITGSDKNPLEWEIKGNDINLELSNWRKANLKVLTENNPDSINIAVKNFVEDNSKNPVSTILLLCYYHRKVNEKEYSSLMFSLQGEAKEEKWLTMIGRSDQLAHSYSFPAAIDNIVLKSSGKSGKDTLRINHRNPMLIYFWQTGDPDRKEAVDSMKAIIKEFPDSSLLLADVCLDVDSAAWRNAIRRDSLDIVKRFWVPMSLADPKMRKLKVNAIPYFIIFDKEGHQYYRGGEITEALKNYRILFNLKDTVATDTIK